MAKFEAHETALPSAASGGVVIEMAGARARGAEAAAQAAAPIPQRGNCTVLFDAVAARLRQSSALCHEGPRPANECLAELGATMLECADDLGHLRATLIECSAREALCERTLAETQAALAQARAELVRTRAGERVARHRALHDELTALPNGRHFRECVSAALAADANREASALQRLAVFYIDLDGFKAINDAHGHAAGDELLRAVAARLAGALRAEDIVGRLGGDEFACLVCAPSLGRLPLTRLAANMFDAIWAPFQIGALGLSVRPSIGIALGPADGHSAELLLRHADAAMYRAKRQQSGHAFFNRQLDA
jgi:diguanylate cyclase